MRKLALALALAFAGTLSSMTVVPSPASAQTVRIGPHGVRIGTGHHRRHHRWERRHHNCRVVVTHRRNRFGEHVTVRRRICR